MTEALTQVTLWAMRQNDVWRIGAGCDVENLASASVMEKAGLARKGILRRWIIHPNISSEPRDWLSYAKVQVDPPLETQVAAWAYAPSL